MFNSHGDAVLNKVCDCIGMDETLAGDVQQEARRFATQLINLVGVVMGSKNFCVYAFDVVEGGESQGEAIVMMEWFRMP